MNPDEGSRRATIVEAEHFHLLVTVVTTAIPPLGIGGYGRMMVRPVEGSRRKVSSGDDSRTLPPPGVGGYNSRPPLGIGGYNSRPPLGIGGYGRMIVRPVEGSRRRVSSGDDSRTLPPLGVGGYQNIGDLLAIGSVALVPIKPE